MLHSRGRSVSEVSRRIGSAAAEFRMLNAVWKHAAVSLDRKIELFNSIVVSRLTYATASMWLLTVDLRRLDGFYCSCLRRILRIPPSFISRISNARALERSGCRKLSDMIRDSQLKLLEKILREPSLKVLRDAAFHGNTLTPQTAAWVRRRGRPRQNWTEQLMGQRQREAA